MDAITLSKEITFGNILTALSMVAATVGAYWALRGKLDQFAIVVEHHVKRIDRLEQHHEERLVRLEDNERRLADMMQRLIGRDEVREAWTGEERRKMPRAVR